MAALTLTHTIYEGSDGRTQFEVFAEIGVHPVRAYGDGWNEPREPAHGETHVVALKVIESTRDGSTTRVEECPAWLAKLILRETQEEADELALEHLYGEDA